MVLVPSAIPATTPVAAPTLATLVLLLAHAPPAGVDANVEFNPLHICSDPVIAVGSAFTVTTAVAVQPPAIV